MQHRLLIDAVEQFGYPDRLIMINPYEWLFPFHDIISSARQKTDRDSTELSASETLHISHVLQELIRGYLCGSNSNKWSNYVFSHNNSKTQKNIKTYFYRFEFQQHSTVHLHLLVWLKNIKTIQYKLIRADIPWENPDCAFLVNKIQPSDKRWLQQNDVLTTFEKIQDRNVLKLFYPSTSFAHFT